MCSEHNVNVNLYGAQIFGYQNNFEYRYPNFNTDINGLANELSFKYLDFLASDYDRTYFKDFTHLNYKGSTVFTEALIKRMQNNSKSTH